MYIPEGFTEDQVIAAINKCADLLSKQFAFGYFDEDDIRGECYVEAIELLNKGAYDPSRSLAAYMYRHLKRRLINLKRDKQKRADPPCRKCHTGEGCEGGSFCRKYSLWHKRNSDKANLLSPMPIQDDEKLTPSVVEQDVQIREFTRKLDEHLSVEHRMLWRKLLDGLSIPKKKRLELHSRIKEILSWQNSET